MVSSLLTVPVWGCCVCARVLQQPAAEGGARRAQRAPARRVFVSWKGKSAEEMLSQRVTGTWGGLWERVCWAVNEQLLGKLTS